MLTPLSEAIDAQRFGGEASALAIALQAGLPVPAGFAIDTDATPSAHDLAALDGAWAVRSSAIGEDSATASFAGQHVTRLGVHGTAALIAAIAEVRASATSSAALAYRAKQGITAPPRMAVILQKLVAADIAGVMFTKNPLTDADELFIEASWGLGEAVVSSLVTPDRIRIAPSGELLERTIGDKELRITLDGTQVDTTPAERAACCLNDDHIAALRELAAKVERVWPGPRDIEFAFSAAMTFLLQRRPLTTRC